MTSDEMVNQMFKQYPVLDTMGSRHPRALMRYMFQNGHKPRDAMKALGIPGWTRRLVWKKMWLDKYFRSFSPAEIVPIVELWDFETGGEIGRDPDHLFYSIVLQLNRRRTQTDVALWVLKHVRGERELVEILDYLETIGAKFSPKVSLQTVRSRCRDWHNRRAEAQFQEQAASLDQSEIDYGADAVLSVPVADTGYTLNVLRTAEQYHLESEAMQHCVSPFKSRYFHRASCGQIVIFSLRDASGRRVATIESGSDGCIHQVQGFKNSKVNDPVCSLISSEFCRDVISGLRLPTGWTTMVEDPTSWQAEVIREFRVENRLARAANLGAMDQAVAIETWRREVEHELMRRMRQLCIDESPSILSGRNWTLGANERPAVAFTNSGS